MLADALLRSAGGATAQLRVATPDKDGTMCEVGLVATTFADVILSPVVMRKVRPSSQVNNEPRWELLVSATSVQQQISALDLDCAQALFAMALTITIAGQGYLIESIATNEAFGQIYLYRLSLRQAGQQSV